MEKSNEIKELSKALQTFQSKMGKILKTNENPFFKSKYASLPTILEAIQKPLEDSNLTFTQMPDGHERDMVLITILIHVESGEYISGSYPINPTKNDPQGLGSAITYARRYALGAILGLNIDEDDDGKKASREVKMKFPELKKLENIVELEAYWNAHAELQKDKEFQKEVAKRKSEFK